MRLRSALLASASILLATSGARADDPPPTQLAIDVDERTAEILVDGRSVGKAPLAAPLPLAPGKHVVEARGESSLADKREVLLAPGETGSIVLRLHPFRDDVIGYNLYRTTPPPDAKDGPRVDALTLAGGTLSVAALAFGVAFNLAANHAASSARADQRAILAVTPGTSACAHPASAVAGACASLASDLASRDRSANLALVGYGVAGAAAVATLAYVFWPRSTEGAHVAPMFLGASGGGAAIGGSF